MYQKLATQGLQTPLITNVVLIFDAEFHMAAKAFDFKILMQTCAIEKN